MAQILLRSFQYLLYEISVKYLCALLNTEPANPKKVFIVLNVVICFI